MATPTPTPNVTSGPALGDKAADLAKQAAETTQQIAEEAKNQITNVQQQIADAHNQYGHYAFLIYVAISVLGAYLIRLVLRFIAKRCPIGFVKDVFQIIVKRTPWIVLVIIFMLLFSIYYLGETYDLTARKYKSIKTLVTILSGLNTAILVAIGTLIIQDFIKLVFDKFVFSADASQTTKHFQHTLITIINILLWPLAFIFFLDNIGYGISTIVAGLGISGVAVALATQTLLSDFFNYFAIAFDHPFGEGDVICFDNIQGTVEKIGIKTTKIRSINGEQIIVSNSAIMNAKIQNFQRLNARRVVFKVGVTYSTPTEKLKLIPEIIKKAVSSQDKAKFDRANFMSFGASSLDFEIVYFALTNNFAEHMNIQEQIYLQIFNAFNQEKIEFAYPTQTLYMAKES